MGPQIRLRVLLALVVAAHALTLGADLLSPYDPGAQHRDLALAPPSRVHLVDAEGRWHLWPFVYRLTPASQPAAYDEDVSERYPIRFLVGRPRADGEDTTRRRLVGVDPPAHLFLLGTDQYGRDQFSRLLHGARVSLTAGVVAASAALLIGLLLGTLSGYFSGLDTLLMRICDLVSAVPWIYLLLAVRSAFPLELAPGPTLAMTVAIIALVGWTKPARLVRSVVMSAKSADFVLAAQGLGGSSSYVVRRHLLPQTTGVLLTQGALLVPQFILAEVTLSFLGLGVGEPAPSWGGMLGAAQQYHVLLSSWWMLAPGVALVAVCFLYQALADAMHGRSGRVAVS